ncbi:MAG: hypothetical protein ACI3XS_00695 [Eubacteriales bacterium]
MKYLFFDIECANCFNGQGKICSFGYVITDDKFNLIKKQDITMDPHAKFHLSGRGNRPGIVLAYDEETFRSSPGFTHYYDNIRSLLTDDNYKVFGFSVMSDAGYIKSECERYSKEIFDYDYIDVQRIYSDMHELNTTPSLLKCASDYSESETQDVHRSDEDSMLTMKVLKGLCDETGLSVNELIEKYPHCKCWCKDGTLGSEYLNYREKLKAQKLWKMEKLTGSVRSNWISQSEEKYYEFSSYFKRVFINKKAVSPLAGKTVCISGFYEDYHFNEMMNIVSLLAKQGAKYTRNALFCDIFVEYEIVSPNKESKKQYVCYRKKKAKKAESDGKNIQFMPIAELFSVLGTNEEKLKNLDRLNLSPLWKPDFIKIKK